MRAISSNELYANLSHTRGWQGGWRLGRWFWLAGLALAGVAFAGADHLWAGLLALAAINACGFFLLLDWLDR